MSSNSKANNAHIMALARADFNNVHNHNLRQSHTQSAEHLDRSKSHLNTYHVLIEGNPHEIVMEDIVANPKRVRGLRSDAKLMADVVLSFGADIQPFFDALPYEEQDQLVERFTQEVVIPHFNNRVFEYQLHRDETNIHAHFQMSRYTTSGERCNFSRLQLQQFQDQLYEFFKAELSHTVERGLRKELTGTKHQKAGTFEAGNPSDALDQMLAQQSVNQMRLKTAREKLSKAQDNAKLKKRVEDYEQRVSNLQARIDAFLALQDAQSRLDALKASEMAIENHIQTEEARIEQTRLDALQQAEEREAKVEKAATLVREQLKDVQEAVDEDEFIRRERERQKANTEQTQKELEAGQEMKRQATKIHEQVCRNQRKAEQAWEEVQDIRVENQQLKESKSALEEENRSLRTELEETKTALSQIQNLLQTLKTEFEHWKSKLASLFPSQSQTLQEELQKDLDAEAPQKLKSSNSGPSMG